MLSLPNLYLTTRRVPSAKSCDWLLGSGASMHLCYARQLSVSAGLAKERQICITAWYTDEIIRPAPPSPSPSNSVVPCPAMGR